MKYKLLLAGIAFTSFQALAFAEDMADAEPLASSSLCTEHEQTIFSCTIQEERKSVSICALPKDPSDSQQTIQYKFGVNGEPLELVYPNKKMPIQKAFSFLTRYHSRGLLETISFSRGDVSYDVMAPEKAEHARWAPFSGVAVTLPNKPPQLFACKQNSVVVDFEPIKQLLKLPEDGHFSDALPKKKIETPDFPINYQKLTTKSGLEIDIAYPIIKEPKIDSEISEFIKGCASSDFDSGPGSKCLRKVTARMVDGKYLVIQFGQWNYGAGTPHGVGGETTNVYKKVQQSWQLIEPDSLFKNSESCRKNIGAMIYRQLAPLRLTDIENKPYDPDWIIKEAEIYPTAQGFEFAYQPYQLGAYADTPWPLLLPWARIDNCLSPL